MGQVTSQFAYLLLQVTVRDEKGNVRPEGRGRSSATLSHNCAVQRSLWHRAPVCLRLRQ